MCLLQPAVVYKTIREGAHGAQSEKPLRLPFNIITVVLTERQVAGGECWGQIPGEKCACVCVCVRVSRKRCTFGHGWSTHCTLGKAFSSVHQQRAIYAEGNQLCKKKKKIPLSTLRSHSTISTICWLLVVAHLPFNQNTTPTDGCCCLCAVSSSCHLSGCA